MRLLRTAKKVPVIKQKGFETAKEFAERVARDFASKRYKSIVVLDFGEEVRIVATAEDTADIIMRKLGTEFVEGFPERYACYLKKIERIKLEKGGIDHVRSKNFFSKFKYTRNWFVCRNRNS